MQLLINHIGYECRGYKSALVLSNDNLQHHTADIVDCQTDQIMMTVPLQPQDKIDQWDIGLTYQLTFTELTTAGNYCVKVGEFVSPTFTLADHLLFNRTFSDLLHYFKSQRCSGEFDRHDKQLPILGTSKKINASGGWYDASGDVSKYLSHLSYANYFNPQQIPMVVWNMLTVLSHRSDNVPPFIKTRLQDEALFGADFLVRIQDESGFFYTTVFDKWSKDPSQREICSYETQQGTKNNQYQAAFRQGGGVAIAALALASRLSLVGEFDSKTYQDAAEKGYWHLKQNNLYYTNDQRENIIDYYCALLACVELYQLTQSEAYLEEARIWASRLAEQQMQDEQVKHFWTATPDGSRPYFHASEAGLPSIALMQYLNIETDLDLRKHFQSILHNAVMFELTLTNEVTNPFGYPRQYIKNLHEDKRTSFFIAQKNETGYWWQGENARLASLAAMAFMACEHLDNPELQQRLHQYGIQALDWILGLNPFDMCMLDGHGYNNPNYLPQLGFDNAKGGICNGITAGFENPHNIAFNPTAQKDDILENWRWGEQWIPHAAWYLLAICVVNNRNPHA